MAASAAAAPQLWAPAHTDTADPEWLIGEAADDIVRRSKHAGWVYEFLRMAREREDNTCAVLHPEGDRTSAIRCSSTSCERAGVKPRIG